MEKREFEIHYMAPMLRSIVLKSGASLLAMSDASGSANIYDWEYEGTDGAED